MIDGIEIFTNIKFQEIRRCFTLSERIQDGGMCTLTLAAGVAMAYHGAVKNRFQNIHYRMVHYPLFKGRGTNGSQFWVCY